MKKIIITMFLYYFMVKNKSSQYFFKLLVGQVIPKVEVLLLLCWFFLKRISLAFKNKIYIWIISVIFFQKFSKSGELEILGRERLRLFIYFFFFLESGNWLHLNLALAQVFLLHFFVTFFFDLFGNIWSGALPVFVVVITTIVVIFVVVVILVGLHSPLIAHKFQISFGGKSKCKKPHWKIKQKIIQKTINSFSLFVKIFSYWFCFRFIYFFKFLLHTHVSKSTRNFIYFLRISKLFFSKKYLSARTTHSKSRWQLKTAATKSRWVGVFRQGLLFFFSYFFFTYFFCSTSLCLILAQSPTVSFTQLWGFLIFAFKKLTKKQQQRQQPQKITWNKNKKG